MIGLTAALTLTSTVAFANVKTMECVVFGAPGGDNFYAYEIEANFTTKTVTTTISLKEGTVEPPLLPIGATYQLVWAAPNMLRAVAVLVNEDPESEDAPFNLLDIDFGKVRYHHTQAGTNKTPSEPKPGAEPRCSRLD